MASKKISKFIILPIYLWQLRIFIPVILVLMLLLSALIYNNFTIDQVKRLDVLQSSEVELKANLIRNFGQVKNVPLYQAKMPELIQLESDVGSRFPSSDEISSLLIQINQIAEDSNVNIINFTPKETKEINLNGAVANKKIMAETFIISANAKYLNFVDFIFRVARLSRVVDVVNIRISRVDNNNVSANFEIKIFFSST